MRINRFALILLGGWIGFLGLARAEASPDAFFPWAKGDSWVYDTLDKKENYHFDMKVVIEGPWDDHGVNGMIMTQKDHRGTMRQFFLMNEKGVFLHKLGLSKTLTPEINTHFTPAMPAVIFPLTPGTKTHWEGRLKVTGIMNKPILFDGEVTGWEDIEVPAGKFHCIKLHFHEKRGNEVIDEDAWYAEGVGQVKYDGGQYIKELKEFKKS